MTDVPAFPTVMLDKPEGGMTLRDYFAAKAMQGAIAGMSTRRDSFSYRECAALCYEMADSMLREREQK